MKIIVAGSRNFTNYELLRDTLNRWTRKLQRVEIISGHAPGADRLGERWATEEAPKRFGYGNVKLTIFHADWDKHGKAAGVKRNQEMADYASPDGVVVLFWNGASKGTADMKQRAEAAGLKVKVVRF